MTEDAKKVWQVMENEFGWRNQPENFHLEYFEDIIKATKQALSIATIAAQIEQLVCDHPDEAIIRDKPTDYCLACNRNI